MAGAPAELRSTLGAEDGQRLWDDALSALVAGWQQVTSGATLSGDHQSVPLDTIVGTVDPRHDFDRHFRPTSNWVRPRWEQLALAQRSGAAIPPIEVYRVGDRHFVSDGHHRVSIAAATGQRTIDAYVTEIFTTVMPSGAPRLSDADPQAEPTR